MYIVAEIQNRTHQLPVECAPSVSSALTEDAAIVFSLSRDANSLDYLGQVYEVHESDSLVRTDEQRGGQTHRKWEACMELIMGRYSQIPVRRVEELCHHVCQLLVAIRMMLTMIHECGIVVPVLQSRQAGHRWQG